MRQFWEDEDAFKLDLECLEPRIFPLVYSDG